MARPALAPGRLQRVAPAPHVRHGLRPEEVTHMLARQGRRCLICGGPIDERSAVIDHDHALARRHGHPEEVGCRRCVRGLLDVRCNGLLGSARDDAAVLRRAAAYVEQARRG